MRIVAVVPARSGSQGLPNKNIMPLAGRALLERSVDFATQLNVDDVIVSTDSESYAQVAIAAGATVPGLRHHSASNSSAMEPAVIDDLDRLFHVSKMPRPDIAIWLRPTFVFRSISSTQDCISMLLEGNVSSARVVTEVDPRIYKSVGGRLRPAFDDGGASMVRRQGMEQAFHVFNTDVFFWPQTPCPPDYLGDNIGYSVAPKLCAVDIDTEEDFQIAENLLTVIGTGILP